MNSRYVMGAGALALAVVTGCAHDPPRSAQSPATPPVVTTTSARPNPGGPARDVVLSDDLLRACKVDLDNTQTAPKFEFDNSAIRAGDRSVLDQVARCVTSGPLKGRALHLVGRADPRGESEYNMVLGSSRASSVAGYLRSLGVPNNQLSTTSRGKLDATGTDEAGWQLDRRVDID